MQPDICSLLQTLHAQSAAAAKEVRCLMLLPFNDNIVLDFRVLLHRRLGTLFFRL